MSSDGTAEHFPETLSLDAISVAQSDGTRLCNPATAIAFQDKGLLFLGSSGAGKTTLAFDCLALGGELISDDAVMLCAITESQVELRRPTNLPSLIEARGIGLLHCPTLNRPVTLSAVVSLDWSEPDRLPASRFVDLGSAKIPLILGAGIPSLAQKLWLLIRNGRVE